MELAFGVPQSQRKYHFLVDQLRLSDQNCKKESLAIIQNAGAYLLSDTDKENTRLRIYLQSFANSKKQAQIYEWRVLTNKPIVKVHLVELHGCPQPNELLGYVYTDHIQRSLASIHNITLKQNIGVLYCLLNGYQSIFRVLAFCGITAKGQYKVWVNSNFSSNQVIGKIFKRQPTIIYQILRVIREKISIDCQYFYIELLRYLDLCETVTFSELNAYLTDYANRHEILLPNVAISGQNNQKNVQIHRSRNYFTQKLSTSSHFQSNINKNQGIPTLIKSKDRIKINKVPESYKKRNTISCQQHLQFRTSPQNQFELKIKRQKERQLRVTEQLFITNKTERKNSSKRNSVLVHPTQRLNEVPRFLTKKVIRSPKYKIKATENFQIQKLEKDSACDNSAISQTNRISNILGSKQQHFFGKENEGRQAWKFDYLQRGSMHSLNNILAQITERNQQNQTERDKMLKRISNNIYSKQQKILKRSCNCHFSHQFSINIINQGSDFKSSEGRKLKRSQISTNKTFLDSQKSSPHKYNQNLFWQLKRKKDAFNSQMINRQNSQFSHQNNFRRNSGQKGVYIRSFERQSDFLKINNTLMQQSIENSSFQKQIRDSVRKQETQRNSIKVNNNQKNNVNVNNISKRSGVIKQEEQRNQKSIFKVRKTQTIEKQDKQADLQNNLILKEEILDIEKSKPMVFKNNRDERNRRMLDEENEQKQRIKAKQQQILSANRWKKTIRNLTGNAQQELKLNMSISYGDQIASNPIRLQRLAKIGREITSSIIPIHQVGFSQHS